jgi:hypothetical protein
LPVNAGPLFVNLLLQVFLSLNQFSPRCSVLFHQFVSG